MTGLDIQHDVILEIAAIITDSDFKQIGQTYYARIKHDPEELKKLFEGKDFWDRYAKSRDDFIAKTGEGKTLDEVDAELSKIIESEFGSELAVLSGNSIHCDKKFIERDWPKIDSKLHYRLLDVSSWKVVMHAKYNVKYDKPEVHRAENDILASIDELQYYLDWFTKNG